MVHLDMSNMEEVTHADMDQGLVSQAQRDAAQALIAATAQIGLALKESQQPVAELGSLISHVADTLAMLRSAPRPEIQDDSLSAVTARGVLEQLQSDVF